jgi:ribosomal protein L11 methylase PrmA
VGLHDPQDPQAQTHFAEGLALSGILKTQAAEVRHAYAPRFDMHIAGGDEDWVLLEGARK